MKLQLNRQIGYTQSWTSTVIIAAIIGAVFSFILVFLQPFDTYNVDMPNKTLKLAGYFIPIVIGIVGIHALENLWFKQARKWQLYHEIVIMLLGVVVITVLSFIYLNNMVNSEPVPWSGFLSWFKSFGLPFAPICLGLWLYLRFRFSNIELNTTKGDEDRIYKVFGTNANEVHSFKWNDFIMATSQSNYVEIILLQDGKPKRIIIRSTLSKLTDQLPEAVQVHRSYIINLEKLERLEGNVRKGYCTLVGLEDQVPVSPKHFKALKLRLQSHP